MAILTEEVGELARVMARTFGDQSAKPSDEGRELADEMADVLWVLLCLANQTGVDLTDAFAKNLQKKKDRVRSGRKQNMGKVFSLLIRIKEMWTNWRSQSTLFNGDYWLMRSPHTEFATLPSWLLCHLRHQHRLATRLMESSHQGRLYPLSRARMEYLSKWSPRLGNSKTSMTYFGIRKVPKVISRSSLFSKSSSTKVSQSTHRTIRSSTKMKRSQ